MDWQFPQPQNTAVITLKRIINKESNILLVKHGADGFWEFLDNQPATPADSAVVGFGEIVTFDPTLEKLKDLQPGQRAVRGEVGADWIIS